jgi:hypothetical protein
VDLFLLWGCDTCLCMLLWNVGSAKMLWRWEHMWWNALADSRYSPRCGPSFYEFFFKLLLNWSLFLFYYFLLNIVVLLFVYFSC